MLEGPPAKVASLVATTCLQLFGPLDPAAWYCFKTHAPFVAILNGKAAAVHTITLDFLTSRLQVLENGKSL